MRPILLIISVLTISFLLSGCVNMTFIIEPKRSLSLDLEMIFTSESDMVLGSIKSQLSELPEDTICEEIEKGYSCKRENVVINASDDLFSDFTYTRQAGFFYTYRMEFAASDNNFDEGYDMDIVPSAMGISMDTVIKPFGKITSTNCLKMNDGKEVSCNLLENKKYYVEWTDFFLFSIFS